MQRENTNVTLKVSHMTSHKQTVTNSPVSLSSTELFILF